MVPTDRNHATLPSSLDRFIYTVDVRNPDVRISAFWKHVRFPNRPVIERCMITGHKCPVIERPVHSRLQCPDFECPNLNQPNVRNPDIIVRISDILNPKPVPNRFGTGFGFKTGSKCLKCSKSGHLITGRPVFGASLYV